MTENERYIIGDKDFVEPRPKLRTKPSRRGVLATWLDENLNSIDPGTDEIAMVILDKLLVEHSCCDTQTFQICDELYEEFLESE